MRGICRCADAVDQGHTLFVISWVNPDQKLAEKSFENYMIEGPLASLAAIESATGERNVNTIGYCLGGTLLASSIAHSPVMIGSRGLSEH